MNYFPCFYYWLMSQTKIALRTMFIMKDNKVKFIFKSYFLSFHSFFGQI